MSVPKIEYIPKDPYKYSDFRGLWNADFKEALTNCFSQRDLNRINEEKEFKKYDIEEAYKGFQRLN